MEIALTLDMRNAPDRRRPWKEFWEDNLWYFTEAEALGFDRLLIQEHFFTDDGYSPSMIAFLTALAERTEKVRIGSYISVLPLHHAARLAQELAVVDNLSGGRLDVGVGSGHRASEYVAFGMSPKTRPSRMDEGLDVLIGAWTKRPFSYHGKYYNIDNMEVQPTPLQEPHPPVWVSATSVAAAERAGRHKMNLHAASVETKVYEAWRAALQEQGSDPSDFRASNPWSITVTDEDPAGVWQRNKELYFYRWDFYRKIRFEMGDPDLNYGLAPSPEEYRANELIGDADTVLSTLEPFCHGLGLTDIVLFGPASGIDLRGEGYESLQSFSEQVMPTLKSW